MTHNFITFLVLLCQPLMFKQYSLEKEISYYFSKLLLFIQYLFVYREADSLLQASFFPLLSDLYFFLPPTYIPNLSFYFKSISFKLFAGRNSSQHLCLGPHCKKILPEVLFQCHASKNQRYSIPRYYKFCTFQSFIFAVFSLGCRGCLTNLR